MGPNCLTSVYNPATPRTQAGVRPSRRTGRLREPAGPPPDMGCRRSGLHARSEAPMWIEIAAVLLPWTLVLGPADPSGPSAPSAEEIDRAIEALGHESFEVRERASDFLWRAGELAEPALRKALQSDDAEAAVRAGRILRHFQYGIHPDTPGEVVILIGRYRYGTQATKLAVLKTLLGRGETSALLTLLRTEPDEASRNALNEGLLKDLDKLIGALLISGDWSRAEQLLEIGAVSDGGMRNYAAYLLLRGQLDAKISKLKDRLAAAPNALEAKLLAYLLRAGGDLPAARSAAENASDTLLTAGILFELGDWQELARLHQASPEKTSATLPGGIVDLGFAAAYHRLAGNTKEVEEAVLGIKGLAERKPNKLWYCGETLLINERYPDAVDLLKAGRPASAFEILCLQIRFREAFRLAGIADVQEFDRPWFAEPGPKAAIKPSQQRDRFAMGLLVASALFRLNERERAVGLFSQLARAANDDNDLSLRSVCEAEYEVGLREEAFARAATVLSRGWNTSVLRTLFPQHQDAAGLWWKLFCQKYPDELRQVTLGRLRRFLQPAQPADPGDDDWRRLVAEAEQDSQRLDGSDRGRWLTAMAEICQARGQPRLAQSHLLAAAQGSPSASTLIRLGDLAAEDADWDEAGRWYRSAWEKDCTKPTPLFRQGQSLLKQGRESEGRKLIEAAGLLSLGNARTRCDFAEDLHQRGLTDEAVRQWQWTLRTGEFQSAAINEAAERLGDLAAEKDGLRAAAYWQWTLMRCLRTSTNNLGVAGYLRRAHRIHKARARGLIATGKIDEALEEVRRSHAALPGEVDLALELVPLLEKVGRSQEAERLFGEVFDVQQRVCIDFPRSTTHRHDLARLAAGCRRRLDEALTYAQEAVALEPGDPAYVSTLAEVHFQRGDRQKAIELAERCIQLAPVQSQFRQQLERFQAP